MAGIRGRDKRAESLIQRLKIMYPICSMFAICSFPGDPFPINNLVIGPFGFVPTTPFGFHPPRLVSAFKPRYPKLILRVPWSGLS